MLRHLMGVVLCDFTRTCILHRAIATDSASKCSFLAAGVVQEIGFDIFAIGFLPLVTLVVLLQDLFYMHDACID